MTILGAVRKLMEVYLRECSLWAVPGIAYNALRGAVLKYPITVDTHFEALTHGRGSVIMLPRRDATVHRISCSNRDIWHYTYSDGRLLFDDPYSGPVQIWYSYKLNDLPTLFQLKRHQWTTGVFTAVRSNTVIVESIDYGELPSPPFTLNLEGQAVFLGGNGNIFPLPSWVHHQVTCYSMSDLYGYLYVTPIQRSLPSGVLGYYLIDPVGWIGDTENVVIPESVMLQAQANMYQYWVRNRALYDQYVGIASVQAVNLDDVLALIANLEMRARMARKDEIVVEKPATVEHRRKSC